MRRFKDFAKDMAPIKAFLGKKDIEALETVKAFLGKNSELVFDQKPRKKRIDEKTLPYSKMDVKTANSKHRLHDHLMSRSPTANEDELDALGHYTSSDGCGNMNRALYEGEKPTGQHGVHHRKLISLISKNRTTRNFNVYTGMRSPEELTKGNTKPVVVQNPAYTSTSISPQVAKSFSNAKTLSGRMSEHVYYHSHGENTASSPSYIEHLTKYDPEQHSEHSSNLKYDDSSPHRDAQGYMVGTFHKYGHVVRVHVPSGSHGVYAEHRTNFPGEYEHILHPNSQILIHPEPTIDHTKQTVTWSGKLIHDGIKTTRHHPAYSRQLRFNFE